MKHKMPHHSVQSVSTLLLFFMFILLLLPVLIMGTGVYRASVEGLERGNNLYTASDYITTKFRQYDRENCRIGMGRLEGIPALTFSETKDGEAYITYLYLKENELKELYTFEGSDASAALGTTIASLSSFSAAEKENGLYSFRLEDEQGHESVFLLHVGVPGKGVP